MRNRVLRELEDLGAGSAPPLDEPRAVRSVERALAPRYSAYLDEVKRLMAAGLAVMQRTGSVAPRVGEIVREAGLSNQVFYRHFRSKDELLLAILDDGTRVLLSYLDHRMSQAATAGDRVRAWIDGVVAQAASPRGADATRPFATHQARLAESFPSEVRRLAELLVTPLRAALRDARDGGEMPGVDPQRDAEAIYSISMGWVQRRLVDEAVPTPEDVAHITAYAVSGLLRGESPTTEKSDGT